MNSSRTPSRTKEFSGSLWQSIHLLLDTSEWRRFFAQEAIRDLRMFRASGLCTESTVEIGPNEFAQHWDEYIHDLTSTPRVDDRRFRNHFSLFLTLDPDLIGFEKYPNGMMSIFQQGAVVRMQLHRFSAALNRAKPILSTVFGPQTISWGVSLSYPQIAQDMSTKKIFKALVDETCPNRLLWKNIVHFSRTYTIPAPLRIEETALWTPIRLGKQAIPWIGQHQELLLSTGARVDIDALEKIERVL